VDDKVWNEFLLNGDAYLIVAAVAVVVAGIAAIATPYVWRRPLPLPRLRPGRWGGREVVLALLSPYVVQFFVIFGLYSCVMTLSLAAVEPVPGRAGAADTKLLHLLVLGSPVSASLTVAVVITLLFALSRTRPHQFGVTWARWPANVVLGVAMFIVMAPVTLGVYLITILVLGIVESPLERMVREGFAAWEWLFLVFMTGLGAPIVEEILFRGVLQGWLRRASLVGHGVLSVVVLLSGSVPLLAHVFPAFFVPQAQDDVNVFAQLGFSILLVAGYVVWLAAIWLRFTHSSSPPADDDPDAVPSVILPACRPGEPSSPEWSWASARASVYGSAMLFAMGHSWPDSIPLFVLGLGLGWLAYRTQSLIGPMVCHSLFNAIACLVLYWEASGM
jgi:membrane protease YdiL (CAAX protease family)